MGQQGQPPPQGTGAIWSLRQRGPLPRTPGEVAAWLPGMLQAIADFLRGLFLLDAETRAARSQVAERAKVYGSFTATAAIPFVLASQQPQVSTETYTTLQLSFAAASGAGRILYTGGNPATGGAVGSGMPIPAGFSTMLVIGHDNIRDVRIIAEGGTSVLIDYVLFQ